MRKRQVLHFFFCFYKGSRQIGFWKGFVDHYLLTKRRSFWRSPLFLCVFIQWVSLHMANISSNFTWFYFYVSIFTPQKRILNVRVAVPSLNAKMEFVFALNITMEMDIPAHVSYTFRKSNWDACVCCHSSLQTRASVYNACGKNSNVCANVK